VITVRSGHGSAIAARRCRGGVVCWGEGFQPQARRPAQWREDDRRNRDAEVFRWIACDHKGGADFIGARNVLPMTLAASGYTIPG
jgi:hypothetical protein